MKYLLDSNTYIQAKNLYYGMDFCPAYWDWLDRQHACGELASIASVYDELTSSNDDLCQWVKVRKGHFLPISDQETQMIFSQIAQYVYELPNKNPDDVVNFLSYADPWLIAKAKVIGATIVTQERPVPDNSKKVKIPNICRQFNVAYVDCFTLLRELKAQFVLP